MPHDSARSPSVLEQARGQLHRWGLGSQRALTVVLVGLTGLVTLGLVAARPWVPPSTYILVELLGSFLLRLRPMILLCAAIVVQVVMVAVLGLGEFTPGTWVLQGIAIVALLAFAAHRERLGLQGAPGELMLVDLRDRIAAHGEVPPLPDGWSVDTTLRPAHAEAFSGDFVVTANRPGLLELALVDVSGKGQAAGVRSLQLSGALAGMIGSLPAREFLPAANAYLLGRRWPEGFATAVHLTVHLETGLYTVALAGHLPPVHLHAGSGRVERLPQLRGPALGVIDDPEYVTGTGRLAPGDTLILYTDGLVETPGGDLDLGIDRLMGAAEELLATRRGGAEDLMRAVRAPEGDDRALVLVRRAG
ncbi:PP2C family protein-serine/threonine phosphatase [Cellulomonas denverensis]|uniref:Serine/threonine-protein phosphatase n=1 Tax=Cellulomonas denverensis TaxID=264297 RepID=A0A7X6QZ22_9CELL|nr:PP2C family protein-serine/threonine phosphatase [Cellulomonas denverensis]NKY22733.1 serine/threonine-protein phosphatase [Cellulomonas denverensis]GIG26197.1 membrane protein [Cellulomonas denverensis]